MILERLEAVLSENMFISNFLSLSLSIYIYIYRYRYDVWV